MNKELYKKIIYEFNNSSFKECYNLAIKLNKNQYDEKILKILTISSYKTQHYIDAIKYGLKLYTSKKIENNQQILNILGVSYSINKDYENGNIFFEKLLLINPKNNSVKYNLALNYFEQKKYIDAEKILSEFISKEIEFENVELIYGMIHSELKNYDKAIEVFENLINRKKKLADVFYNLGIIYQKINNYTLSIKYLEKAIEQNDTNHFFFNSLGVSQQKMFNYKEAEKNYNLAISLNKNYSNAFSNLGLLKKRQGFFDDAIKYFDQALNIEPKNSQILYNKSICLLETGNYKEGLNLYKWRQNGKYAKNNYLDLDIKTIRDKKILITCDQGLGDTILLSRYVLLLLNYNAQVVFQIPKSLKVLFKNFNKEIHLTSEPVLKENFNYIYSLGDLLKIFKVNELNIQKKDSYINIDHQWIEKWENRIDKSKFNIGIAWQGKEGTSLDEGRSFRLNNFQKISKMRNIQLISLQKNDGLDQIKNFSKKNKIINFDNNLDIDAKFMDTAGIMKNLDLVITSDTSIVHLAGALGVSTWLLVQKYPHWYWRNINEKSLWYESVKILRQTENHNWKKLFLEVELKLSDILKKNVNFKNI